MRRTKAVLVSVGCCIAAGACSIAGSWKTIAVDPTGGAFPVDRMSFDRNHNYTATWSHEGENRTSTGRYRWNGFRLDIAQAGGQPRVYRARRRLDGKLVLTFGEGRRTVSAILVREEAQPVSRTSLQD